VTRTGNQHAVNQDRSLLDQPLNSIQSTRDDTSFLIGVFDGHGDAGHIVADFVCDTLPRRLATKLNASPCCQSPDWISKQLNETIVELDQELPPQAALRGGTTASVALRVGDLLYIVNTGDSRIMLVTVTTKNHTNCIVFQSSPHKPHPSEERSRIEAAGGTIHVPRNHPDQSRVVVYSITQREPVALAICRSIGDWEWKPFGVTAEPTITVLNLSMQGVGDDDFSFIMAASDGVWDQRPPQRLADLLGQALESPYVRGKRIGASAVLAASTRILRKVSPMKEDWYRDDMTVAILPF
jgi:serine/threonine protein phosphatase PrpC